ILRADDARRAIEAGADGVVVSNHGARNLDGATPSITALPAIAAEIGQHGTILLDSGIRHGADIARALALGADAILLGRAVLFGLAAYGQAGAARALQLLRHEFETAMALLGATSPAEITRDLVLT
ncbi:MAG: alpha-hydroxy-acid oxidizing protein, partial [Roseomonas sp.]|nr:alpha-hydroxy-acid oxidizing protein [Roseomonas sp.]